MLVVPAKPSPNQERQELELRSILRSNLTPSEVQKCPAGTLWNDRQPFALLRWVELTLDSRVKWQAYARPLDIAPGGYTGSDETKAVQ
jgi:hypothetical protein